MRRKAPTAKPRNHGTRKAATEAGREWRHRSGLAIVLALAFGCASAQSSPVATAEPRKTAPNKSPLPEALRSRLALVEQQRDTSLRKYKALGLNLHEHRYGIKLLPPEAFSAGIGRNAQHFELPGLYDALSATARLLGASVGRSPDELRTLAPVSLGALALAYYDFDNKVLVLRSDPKQAIASPDEVVAHELGHAYQDSSQGGIQQYIEKHSHSADALRAAHAILEGEASLLAESLSLADLGLTLDVLKPELTDPSVGRLTTGEAYSLIYDSGRRFLLHHYGHLGLPGIVQGFRAPPSSTEQLLHPEKFNRDLPRDVELPQIPSLRDTATLLFDGTLGEMLIYSRLLSVTKDLYRARLAATGWDGDRLRVYKFSNGSYGLLWRILWDRPADAAQFRDIIRPMVPGGTLCAVLSRDNTVDVAYAETPQESALLAAAARELPAVAAVIPEDAASTERAEALDEQLNSLRPRIVQTYWVWPALGLSFEVPEGFFDVDVNGVSLLTMMPKDNFANNITVTFEQDLYRNSPERFVQVERQSLEKSGQIWVGSHSVSPAGTPAVVIETRVLADAQVANALILSIPRGNGLRLSIVVATGSGQLYLAHSLMDSIQATLVLKEPQAWPNSAALASSH